MLWRRELLRRRWPLGTCGSEADIVETEVIEIKGAGAADFIKVSIFDEDGVVEVGVVKAGAELTIIQAVRVEFAQIAVDIDLLQAIDVVVIAEAHVKQAEGLRGFLVSIEVDELVEGDLRVTSQKVGKGPSV